MAAVDEHVVMANPVTGDVAVVTKREFDKVWSRGNVTDSRGQVVLENPWKPASEVDSVTTDQLVAAARAAGVKLPDVDGDSDDTSTVIAEIETAAATTFGHAVEADDDVED